MTGSIITTPEEMSAHENLVQLLQNRVGRMIFNGVPTGVEVCPSMQHGGPYPASTDASYTASRCTFNSTLGASCGLSKLAQQPSAKSLEE